MGVPSSWATAEAMLGVDGREEGEAGRARTLEKNNKGKKKSFPLIIREVKGNPEGSTVPQDTKPQ